MQDRFKFRVWDKPTGQMFYDVALGFIKAPLCEDWVCVDTPEGQMSYTGLRLKDIEIMQCTGLKDKNGKLIYESDVIKLEYFDYGTKYLKAIVEWEDNGYCVTYIKPTDTKVTGGDLKSWLPKIEVIGNIYTNPELLEVKE